MSDGRCPFATWIGSPFFGYPQGTHGQLKAMAICDHIMCGYLTGCDSWFRNPTAFVSAHFGIGQNGDIHQYVSLEDCAWANGAINKPDPSIAAVYTGQNPNRSTISVEHEGWPKHIWTSAMYETDLKLKRWLLERWPALLLIGHYQLDSVSRAQCPGPNWPRDRLLADLKEEDMVDEARFAELERALADERSKQDIRADTEAFLASFGKSEAEHEAAFRRLYEEHIKWRVEGKPWR